MNIFDWFRSKPAEKQGVQYLRGIGAFRGQANLENVPKWTHAGKKGKDIVCPSCLQKTHVSNFAWTALVCSSCDATVEKYDWLIERVK